MVSYDSALVVLASSLAGVFDRMPIPSFPHVNTTTNATNTCSNALCHCECNLLDAAIHPLHIFVPWAITMATILGLSMPTMLLCSKSKEKGLRVFAGNLLSLFALILAASCASPHPSVCYTFTIHSCVRLLLQMQVSRALLGGAWWWSLRYLSVFLILALQLCAGPSISVVYWPPPHAGDTLPCAYLSHLIGCIAPGVILCCISNCLAWTRCTPHIKDS